MIGASRDLGDGGCLLATFKETIWATIEKSASTALKAQRRLDKLLQKLDELMFLMIILAQVGIKMDGKGRQEEESRNMIK